MKKQRATMMEADHLADVLLSTTNYNQITSLLGELTPEDIQDLSTTILRNGHTMLHLLAQRQKLQALHALLQRGVRAYARNAQGNTPLYLALRHNCLNAAKLLIEEGDSNVSEVISKRKGTTLLHQMVTCDRPQAVKLLLDHKAEVNRHDREGRTPFHLAAVYGYSKVAAIFLRHEQCDVNALDNNGYTALMLAILNDNQELARQLVDSPSVDVLLKDPKDRSSLHMAVSRGQLEVVRALLRRNSANLHCKERSMGRTPIHLACALVCSQSGVVTSNCLFDEDNHNLNDVASAGTFDQLSDYAQPNDNAHLNGSVDEVLQEEQIAMKGSFPAWSGEMDDQDVPGNMESRLGGSLSEMKRDLSQIRVPVQPQEDGHETEDSGVNGHTEDRSSGSSSYNEEHSEMNSARLDEVNGNFAETVSPKVSATIALRKGQPKKQQTPRQQTVKSQSRETNFPSKPSSGTKAKGTDPSPSLRARHSISGEHVLQTSRIQPSTRASGPQKQMTPAAKRSSFRRPATAPASNRHRSTPSVSFADVQHRKATPSMSREPLRSQSSVALSVTPYNIGIIRHRLVSLLLDYGADANLMTSFRKSPLHIAAIMGAADVVAVLLPHITNVNVLSASNRTALHLAVERNHVAVASQLIHAGANLSLRDIAGRTALHYASRFGYVAMVSLLLKARAEKDTTDFQQMTPLHHACLHNHPAVIDILMIAGACLHILDVSGLGPLDYRKALSTTDRPDLSSECLENSSYSSGLSFQPSQTSARSEKRRMTSFCGVDDKSEVVPPQPALDFQKPGVLFKKHTLQKAS